MSSVTFRKASPSDWPAVAALLSSARLPLDGAQEHLHDFLVAFQGTTLIGLAGIERYEDVALLRSVAVAQEKRGTGLGQELVRRILSQIRTDGATLVALLTTTADGFFPRFGFRRVDRSAFPQVLQNSAELRGACPASSVAMLLDLRPAQRRTL